MQAYSPGVLTGDMAGVASIFATAHVVGRRYVIYEARLGPAWHKPVARLILFYALSSRLPERKTAEEPQFYSRCSRSVHLLLLRLGENFGFAIRRCFLRKRSLDLLQLAPETLALGFKLAAPTARELPAVTGLDHVRG